jgi:thioredoxin 1
MNHTYAATEPPRAEIDALMGPTIVEFGAPWCPHCKAVQAPLSAALDGHEGVRHYKIEDGAGKPLGRSFNVKLWPTLVFMKDGVEISRLVRATQQAPIDEAVAQIDPAAA